MARVAIHVAPADTRYKSLADIERGFKVLKSADRNRPGVPPAAGADSGTCFDLLHGADPCTESCALEQLCRIQHHRIRLNGAKPVTGVSSICEGQSEVFSALRVKKPAASQPA